MKKKPQTEKSDADHENSAPIKKEPVKIDPSVTGTERQHKIGDPGEGDENTIKADK